LLPAALDVGLLGPHQGPDGVLVEGHALRSRGGPRNRHRGWGDAARLGAHPGVGRSPGNRYRWRGDTAWPGAGSAVGSRSGGKEEDEGKVHVHSLRSAPLITMRWISLVPS